MQPPAGSWAAGAGRRASQRCQEEVELNCLEKLLGFRAGPCDGSHSGMITANPVPSLLPVPFPVHTL